MTIQEIETKLISSGFAAQEDGGLVRAYLTSREISPQEVVVALDISPQLVVVTQSGKVLVIPTG